MCVLDHMAAGLGSLGYPGAFTIHVVPLELAGVMLKHIHFNSSQVLD